MRVQILWSEHCRQASIRRLGMDIRAPVLAVIVGGAPAPGINSVISAVVLEGLNNGCTVIGIKEGM